VSEFVFHESSLQPGSDNHRSSVPRVALVRTDGTIPAGGGGAGSAGVSERPGTRHSRSLPASHDVATSLLEALPAADRVAQPEYPLLREHG
jgi:hypothetical protein